MAGFFIKNMDRQIKGIFIPIEVWQDQDLSWNEKILLMEIDSFTSKGMDCYFSNEYVAGFLGVKPNTASILISKLIEKGYVKKTRFDGRHRYLESTLSYTIGGRVLSESNAGFDENQMQGLTEIKHNNINNNKDEYIDREYKGASRFVKPSLQEVRDYCLERGNTVDPETFVDFYESKGWKIGNQPMKDWKAAVRTWERSRTERRDQPRQQSRGGDSFSRMMETARELGIKM